MTRSPCRPRLSASGAGAVERAGAAFRQLHDKAPDFAFRFELFKMIDDYLAVVDKLTRAAARRAITRVVVEATVGARTRSPQHPVPLKPCHCDPLCENFLDTGERMWIVDWEYSGMNDPMWDLGDLSVEGGFDAAQDEATDRRLFRPAGERLRSRPHGDLQGDVRPPVDAVGPDPARQQESGRDFWAYAVNRFERCKALMRSPDFAKHLDAVRRG